MAPRYTKKFKGSANKWYVQEYTPLHIHWNGIWIWEYLRTISHGFACETDLERVYGPLPLMNAKAASLTTKDLEEFESWAMDQLSKVDWRPSEMIPEDYYL